MGRLFHNPASANLPNSVAFRLAPYHYSPVKDWVAADLNDDKIIDPIGPIENDLGLIIKWSYPSPDGNQYGMPGWQEEIINDLSGYDRVVVGDFDGNKAQDLLLISKNGSAKIIYLKKPRGRALTNTTNLSSYTWRQSRTRIKLSGTPVVGNFDGRKGDDLVWAISSAGRTRARMLLANGRRGFRTGRLARIVGDGDYTPLSGNFNGKGGTDLFWLDKNSTNQVLWLSKKRINKTDCGPKLGRKCVWGNMRAVNRLSLLEDLLAELVTVGDFDGNGADDLFIKLGNTPNILFSAPQQSGSYASNYEALSVSLHNSFNYNILVGEFDNAHNTNGDRLGDDILLY